MGVNYEHMKGYDEVVDGFAISWHITSCEENPRDHFCSDNPADDEDIFQKIENGALEWFDVKCEASKAGVVLGSDYLGACCYESFKAFHDAQDYARDMVAAAIADARQSIAAIVAEK